MKMIEGQEGWLAEDQWGRTYRLTSKHPRQELMDKLGYLKAEKMYLGENEHIGYVIGQSWLTLYRVFPVNYTGNN